MTWGKGIAYPLIGDKVRVRPERQYPDGPFDGGIWEVSYINSFQKPPYRLVPWPRNRIQWGSFAEANIRAYDHDLVKLNALELIMIAAIEA